jgi:hypothetical protein
MTLPTFHLRFDKAHIPAWAAGYKASDDHQVEFEIAPQVHQRGYFIKAEFQAACCWKTPRSKPRVESNPESFVQEVTRVALSTPDERLRIEVLTLLEGVGWPTASALLHFGHHEPYPILDIRALWSLGVEDEIDYDFTFWWAYTQFCRRLAQEVNVSMRVLDRALWQYSADNQETAAQREGGHNQTKVIR